MTDAYSYIRFSSPQQALGHSQRRQQDQIDRFVKENNLSLQNSEAFRDLGVSGFRGLNLKQGLGRFIAEVDANKVKRGSYLIVESLDRLSRQNVMDSFRLLVSLIDKGIRVVALNDTGPTVLDKSADFSALMLTLGTLYRAYDESSKKSMRGKAVWQQKKRNAQFAPVSSRCPEWLSFNAAKKAFDPIPDRVRTIQKIFDLADQGIGRHRIVRLLNQQGIKSFRNVSNGWQGSSVSKLLRNRALIGFYQPTTREYDPETGRELRNPDGNEVAGYYPVVIDEALFRRVSTRRHMPVAPLAGRQGPALTNLFTGIVFCGWCGAPMAMCNKGPPPKGRRYLVCSKAVRGKGCTYRSWPYDHIEPMILSRIRELDFGEVLGTTTAAGELAAIRDRKAVVHEQIETCKKTLSNMQDSVAQHEGTVPKGFLQAWNREEEKDAELRLEMETLNALEIEVANRQSDPAQLGEQLVQLYDAMDNATPDERYLLRVRLRARLGLAVERIIVRPLSSTEQHQKRSQSSVPVDEFADQSGNYAPTNRTVVLKFRNGASRTIVAVGSDQAFILNIAKKGVGTPQPPTENHAA
jgi:DNA invertase Pin-like site-specific DNA recombinase